MAFHTYASPSLESGWSVHSPRKIWEIWVGGKWNWNGRIGVEILRIALKWRTIQNLSHDNFPSSEQFPLLGKPSAKSIESSILLGIIFCLVVGCLALYTFYIQQNPIHVSKSGPIRALNDFSLLIQKCSGSCNRCVERRVLYGLGKYGHFPQCFGMIFII